MKPNKFFINHKNIKEKIKKYVNDYILFKKHVCITKYKNILNNLLGLNIKNIIFRQNNIFCVLNDSNEKYNVPTILHNIILKYIYLQYYFDKYIKVNSYPNRILCWDFKMANSLNNHYIKSQLYICKYFLDNKLNYFNKLNYYGEIIYDCKYYYYVCYGKLDLNTIIKIDFFAIFIILLITNIKLDIINNFKLHDDAFFVPHKCILHNSGFIYERYSFLNLYAIRKSNIDYKKIEESLANISQAFIDNLISYEIIEYIHIITYYIYSFEKYSKHISNKFIIIKNKLSEIINASNILNTIEYKNFKEVEDIKLGIHEI